MKEVKVLIDSFEKITEFVSIVEKCDINANLDIESAVVNACSLVGIMALVSNTPVSFLINEKDDIADDAINKIGKFVVG